MATDTAAQPPAGIWVPTELAERVHETMGEFLMDHGWRQQDMDTSDEFGALLAVATKAAPAPAVEVGGPLNELEELNLLNKLIELGARAANAHAASNSDDGHKGTAAYVQWQELRSQMGDLIRAAYAAPTTQAAPAPQDAEDAVLSAVKLQAKIWKQEARTQAAIVRDCYQLATDATGEPGDWDGSNPVREKIVALTEARDALVAALERAYFWMDSQADTQSKGCHATFDLMMLREERDAAKAAIDAARAKQEGK